MPNTEHPFPTTVRQHDAIAADMNATLFVALELSLTRWIVVASAPGEEKTSQHSVSACDGPALLTLLDRLAPPLRGPGGRP